MKINNFLYMGAMDWAAFREMPDDMQRAYYRAVCWEYGVEAYEVAEMLDIPVLQLMENLERLGMDNDLVERGPSMPDQWNLFLHGLRAVNMNEIEAGAD